MMLNVYVGRKKKIRFDLIPNDKTEEFIKRFMELEKATTELKNQNEMPIKWRCLKCGCEIKKNNSYCDKHKS